MVMRLVVMRLPLHVLGVVAWRDGVLLPNLPVLALDRDITATRILHNLRGFGVCLLLSSGVRACTTAATLDVPSTRGIRTDDAVVLRCHDIACLPQALLSRTRPERFIFAKAVGKSYVGREP